MARSPSPQFVAGRHGRRVPPANVPYRTLPSFAGADRSGAALAPETGRNAGRHAPGATAYHARRPGNYLSVGLEFGPAETALAHLLAGAFAAPLSAQYR